MRKLLLAMVIVFCGISVSAQIYVPKEPTVYGNNFLRTHDSLATGIPTKVALQTNTNNTGAQIFYYDLDSTIWAWSFKKGFFQVGGNNGGGGVADDSIFVGGYIDTITFASHPGKKGIIVPLTIGDSVKHFFIDTSGGMTDGYALTWDNADRKWILSPTGGTTFYNGDGTLSGGAFSSFRIVNMNGKTINFNNTDASVFSIGRDGSFYSAVAGSYPFMGTDYSLLSGQSRISFMGDYGNIYHGSHIINDDSIHYIELKNDSIRFKPLGSSSSGFVWTLINPATGSGHWAAASGGSGTVTSVAALTLGTTGTDLTSSVATGTTTPIITLNVPTASASNRGALLAADWTTFNNKQPQLNGTGFVKATGNTISYDNSTYLTTVPNLLQVTTVGNTTNGINFLRQFSATAPPAHGNTVFDSTGLGWRDSTGRTVFLNKSLVTSGTTVIDSFQNKSGRIALLSDITSATVDTTTAITGVTTLYTLGRINVRKYGAVGDGTTNDQTAITNAIAATPAGGVLYFPEGTYLVSTTVSVNKAITIQGTGNSRIKVTGNISAFTLNSNNVNIDFLNFHGSGKAGGNTSQIGINCNSFVDFAVSNCQFDSLNGIGLFWLNTTVGINRYGGRVINCLFNLNNVGFQAGASGEYISVIGGVAKYNTKGCSIAAGNIVVSGMDIHDNGIGIFTINGANNGHSTFSACKINHNSTYNIQIADDSLGMEFSGCQIFDSYIYLKNSIGISFVGCEIAPIQMYFENATGTRFSSNVFYTSYGFVVNNNYNSTTSETFFNNNQYLGGSASGVFIGQDTTKSAGNLLEVMQNKNNTISASIQNTNTSTLSNSQFQAKNDAGNTIAIQALGTGWTTQGIQVANSGRLITTSGMTGGLYIGTAGHTAPLIFGTDISASENMRLNASNGHLLVGTTTDIAASKVIVSGDVNSTSFTGATFYGGTTTSSPVKIVTTSASSSVTGSDFIVANGNNGNNDLFHILNTGLVGIGTASPINQLNIVNNQNNVTRLEIDNSSTGTAARAGVFFTQNQSSQAANIEYLGSGFSAGVGFEALRANALFNATGTGASGGLSIDVTANAPFTISTGGTATANERMRISGTGNIIFPSTNTTTGTTGAQTINKPSGSVNFAAAATTLVVTNSLATTTSNIFIQVEGTDATATSARVTKAAGSFTITLNAAATAETRVSFWIIN